MSEATTIYATDTLVTEEEAHRLARRVLETQEAVPTLGELFSELLRFVPEGAREEYRRQFRLRLVAWTKTVFEYGQQSGRRESSHG